MANIGFNEVSNVASLGNPFAHGANPTIQFSRTVPGSSSTQASTSGQAFAGCRATAFIKINPGVTNDTAFTHVVSHELGHTFALDDCSTCRQGSTAMTLPQTPNLNEAGGHSGPTSCDISQMRACIRPTPTPEPPPESCIVPLTDSSEEKVLDNISQMRPVEPGDCSEWGWWNEQTCQCEAGSPPPSPIVLDISGNGFDLTNAANGVRFDLNGDGIKEKLSWTSAGSDDAWLALDRNNDGMITTGAELFGNFTAQPLPPRNRSKNGFIALAEFDKLENGGNSDGKINRRDMIFNSLRLWRDINHNGISESSEIFLLADLEVRMLDLDYVPSRRTDEHGINSNTKQRSETSKTQMLDV